MRDLDRPFEFNAVFDQPSGPVRIALTDERARLGWWVSTVQMARPASRRNDLQYETLVFGGPLDQYRVHYLTAEQAVAGHDQVVAEVRDRQHAIA